MVEDADGDVALHAEKAAYDVGLVAVIYAEATTVGAASFRAWWFFAYAADAILSFKHFLVHRSGYAVERFHFCVAAVAGVFQLLFSIPFTFPGSVSSRVLLAAFSRGDDPAWLASGLKSVFSFGAFVKFRSNFALLT